MIYDDIKNFNQQFSWIPKIEHQKALKRFKKVLVCGMGGSHLAADVLLAWKPELQVVVWHDYGLPPIPKKDLKESLIIFDSYSGNTEETLDAFAAARKQKFAVAVIASGGRLLELARKNKIPYIALPPTHEQPRMAIGYALKAVVCLLRDQKLLREISALAQELRPDEYEEKGRSLASRLSLNVPVIYASSQNGALAMNWKIVLNETGKVPAFWNTFPELNHNEMTGFDVKRSTRELSSVFHFILLTDGEDSSPIAKRMLVLQGMYRDRGLKVELVPVQGSTRLGKIVNSISLAQWTAYYTARNYGIEPEEVPMVEEFKKMIR
jgi:glucose/mannose-6-phosphate isomerase